MVGKGAAGQPVLPVVGGPHHPAIRLLEGVRRRNLGPGERAEPGLALLDQGASRGPRSLEADPHVGGEGKLQVDSIGPGDPLVVPAVGVRPLRRLAAVVEHRLTVERQLDLAVDAADGAEQAVVGVVVGRCSAVGGGQLLVVMPGTDEQQVADDHPPGRGAPARLQHHGAGQVAPRRRHVDVGGAEAEAAGGAIEEGPEDARRVHPRQAEPFHVAARRHQRSDLVVAEERVLGDGRERRLAEQRRRRARRHRSPLPQPALHLSHEPAPPAHR